jgi:two-component system chemotaxis sensor kinase CheA
VGSETYIVPLDSIVECLDLDPERTLRSSSGGVIELRGQPLPYLSLSDQLAAPGDRAARRSIVVLEHGGERAGLAVDALLGEVQTLIKPLGQLFSNVRLVSGTAVLGDGRIALVLDVGNLLRAAAA